MLKQLGESGRTDVEQFLRAGRREGLGGQDGRPEEPPEGGGREGLKPA